MKKIYITLTSILLGTFLFIAILVSKEIYSEYSKKNQIIGQLRYIQNINSKIESLNNIYELTNTIDTLNKQSTDLDTSITNTKKQINDLEQSNTKLETIIKSYKEKK